MAANLTDYSFLSFATSNQGKYREAVAQLPGLKLLSVELPEIQGLDTKKITEAKLQHVATLGLKQIIVEDVALHFDGLNGLPGPLIKWFLKALKTDGLYDLVHRSSNMRAEAVAVIGYRNDRGESFVVEGRVPGMIATARGGDGFGWDPIFVPDGSPKSYAEMTDAEKSTVSHRGRAIDKLKEILG